MKKIIWLQSRNGKMLNLILRELMISIMQIWLSRKQRSLRDRLRAPKLSPLRKTDRFDSLLQAPPGIKQPEFDLVGSAVQAQRSQPLGRFRYHII